MRLKILHRYLLQQNLFYLFLMLSVGIGIYLLIDVFEFLDRFLESGMIREMILFFIYKIPYIVSQIFPAVILLAALIQLGLMRQNMELLALQAGAISFSKVVFFFCVYAFILSWVQLFISDVLSVWGSEKSTVIWQQQVKKTSVQGTVVDDIWFREGEMYVHIEQAYIVENKGKNIQIVFLRGQDEVEKIVKAKSFVVQNEQWVLFDVDIFRPDLFVSEHKAEVAYPFTTEFKSFQVLDLKRYLELLSLPDLVLAVSQLEAAGSNVEWLKTALYGRVSYAFSIFALIFSGMAFLKKIGNIYLLVLGGVFSMFCYYSLFVFFTGLGEHGIIPPWLGAWLVNILFVGFSGYFLAKK